MLFLPFVYKYPSSCPCAHCTPNKSVPTLRYTRRHGPVYTGAVPWISEDRLLDNSGWINLINAELFPGEVLAGVEIPGDAWGKGETIPDTTLSPPE